jgi:hypothetical protein
MPGESFRASEEPQAVDGPLRVKVVELTLSRICSAWTSSRIVPTMPTPWVWSGTTITSVSSRAPAQSSTTFSA